MKLTSIFMTINNFIFHDIQCKKGNSVPRMNLNSRAFFSTVILREVFAHTLP